MVAPCCSLVDVDNHCYLVAFVRREVTEPSVPSKVRRRGKHWRIVGIFLHDWFLIIAAFLNHQLLPVKPGRPGAWPKLPRGPTKHSWLLVRWKAEGEKTYTCKPNLSPLLFFISEKGTHALQMY